MAPPDPPFVVSTRKQLAALASGARQEIVDVLANTGAVSVAELAQALGRPADALYYHLRVLQQAGLVIHAGYRGRGKHREELIAAVSPNLRLPYELGEGGNGAEIGAIVGSMLRLGVRDFDAAFEAGEVKTSGPERELLAMRKIGWLTPRDVAEANRAIEGLAQLTEKPAGRGRLYAITVLLTPLDRRARGNGKARAAPRKANPE
jgi:DNA-binding transcriptional ArsR family regulator